MTELHARLVSSLATARAARRTGYRSGVRAAAVRAMAVLEELGEHDLALRVYREIYKLTEER